MAALDAPSSTQTAKGAVCSWFALLAPALTYALAWIIGFWFVGNVAREASGILGILFGPAVFFCPLLSLFALWHGERPRWVTLASLVSGAFWICALFGMS